MDTNWAFLAAFLSVVITTLKTSYAANTHWVDSKNFHEKLLKSPDRAEIVHPLKTDTDGSYYVTGNITTFPQNIRLVILAFGKAMKLNLKKNWMFAPHFKVQEFKGYQYMFSNVDSVNVNCTYTGYLDGEDGDNSFVAISLCNRMRGLIVDNGEKYFMEPLHPQIQNGYRRSIDSVDGSMGHHIMFKSSTEDALIYDSASIDIRKHISTHLRSRRSYPDLLAAEILNVELCLVVDKTMVDYYADGLHEYVATIMNIVQHLYRLESLGTTVNIVLTRLVILKEDPPGLPLEKLKSDGIAIKKAFDDWHMSLNVEDDSDPDHFDFIMLYTRVNMRQFDGIAELAKMCDPVHSSGIAEDRGLRGAEVIAHELGHSLGLDHDHYSKDPDCREHGSQGSIMGTTKTSHQIGRYFWSKCSREALQFYTGLGRFTCLLDAPAEPATKVELEGLPGQHINVVEQCQRTCGNGFEPRLTGGRHPFCTDLYCVHRSIFGYIDKACLGKQVPLEGTTCEPEKHCINQECVSVSVRPLDGGWSVWEDDGMRTCTSNRGLSVRKRTRICNNPEPKHGGKPCPGPDFDYVQCETEDEEWSYVEIDYEALRHQLCKKATREYGTRLEPDETFQPGICFVNCLDKETSRKYQKDFPNGTRCDGNSVCINGWCKRLVCGHAQMLYEGILKEDLCGVCFGNNTSCESHQVKTRKSKIMQGDETCGLPVPRGKACLLEFPRGSRNIDFNLQNDREYYKFVLRSYGTVMDLEGRGWGKFAFAGTNWFYNEFYGLISTKGPVLKDVEVLIETISGDWKREVWYMYQYHVRKETSNSLKPFRYRWHKAGWGRCSQPCGRGLRVTIFVCMRDDGRTVEDHQCSDEPKPNLRTERCNTQPCHPRWHVGLWSNCCDITKDKMREVRCVRPLGHGRFDYLDDSRCASIGFKPSRNTSCLPSEYNLCTGHVETNSKKNGCPLHWTGFDDHCYRGFLKPNGGVDQEWAEYHCLAHSGHLAHISSLEANQFIYSLLRNTSYEKRGWKIGAYIGMKWFRNPTKLNGGGDMEWLDGDASSGFTNWADETQPYNPDVRHCVILSGSTDPWNAGKWESAPCEAKRDCVVCSRLMA